MYQNAPAECNIDRVTRQASVVAISRKQFDIGQTKMTCLLCGGSRLPGFGINADVFSSGELFSDPQIRTCAAADFTDRVRFRKFQIRRIAIELPLQVQTFLLHSTETQ